MGRFKALLMAAAMLSTVALGGGSARAAATVTDCNSNFVGSGNITHICEYQIKYVEYDGRNHYFVVRYSDSAVFHTWETRRDSYTYAPWTGLGGVARSQVWLKTFDNERALRIQVRGTDNGYWCRSYNDPSARGQWTGWYTC